jgi:hypothetical protein
MGQGRGTNPTSPSRKIATSPDSSWISHCWKNSLAPSRSPSRQRHRRQSHPWRTTPDGTGIRARARRHASHRRSNRLLVEILGGAPVRSRARDEEQDPHGCPLETGELARPETFINTYLRRSSLSIKPRRWKSDRTRVGRSFGPVVIATGCTRQISGCSTSATSADTTSPK